MSEKIFDFPCRVLYNDSHIAGCGSVWSERLVWDQEVAGSNPVTPIFYGQRLGGWL